MKYKSSDFVFDLQGAGRNVFTLQEMAGTLRVSQKSAREIIARLVRGQRVVSLTTGLYALVHPSERKHGIRPLHVIDAIMQHRKTFYYVGLLSAADYWGAAHQKPMGLQVLVPRQITLRKQREIRVSLHVKRQFPKEGIIQATTETGRFSISSPSLTALDVITYESASGGLDNVFLVIQGLLTKITARELKSIIATYRPATSIQRFGYLLQRGKASKVLMRIVEGVITKNNSPIIPLSVSSHSMGKIDQRWRLMINHQIEEQNDF